MAPPPALSMPGRTARVIRNMDVTFFAKRASHSAKVRSRNGLTDSPPAWLKRQTHGPCAASAAATASDTYPRRRWRDARPVTTIARRRRSLALAGQVARHSDRNAARCTDLGRDSLGAGGVDVHHRDLRAFGRKELGRGGAHARRGTGHDRRAALEPTCPPIALDLSGGQEARARSRRREAGRGPSEEAEHVDALGARRWGTSGRREMGNSANPPTAGGMARMQLFLFCYEFKPEILVVSLCAVRPCYFV